MTARGVFHGLGLKFWSTEFLSSAGGPSKPAAQHSPAGNGLQRGKVQHKSPARLGLTAKTQADISLAWLHGAVCAWFLSPLYLFPPLSAAWRRCCLKSRLSTISSSFFPKNSVPEETLRDLRGGAFSRHSSI